MVNFRYIGVTDECVQCQCCGKDNLKSTVVLALLDADGNDEEITYYGSTCAAKALAVKGGGKAVRKSAEWAAMRTRNAAKDARRTLAHYQVCETGEIQHPRGLNGVAFEYRWNNSNDLNPHWRHTWGEWKEMTLGMIARHVAAINEAKLLGVTA